MDCPNCGRTLLDDSRFCSWCGKDAVVRTPEPGDAVVETSSPASPPAPKPEVHPWLRYFARTFDLTLAVVIFLAAVRLGQVQIGRPAIYFAGVMVYAVYFAIESVMIWRTGTTPGKFLFRITVESRSGERGYDKCWRRSLGVFVRGVAMGIPFVMLAAQMLSYMQLMRDGQTSWDRDFGFEVKHGLVGPGRVVIIVLLFVVLTVILAEFIMRGMPVPGPSGDV